MEPWRSRGVHTILGAKLEEWTSISPMRSSEWRGSTESVVKILKVFLYFSRIDDDLRDMGVQANLEDLSEEEKIFYMFKVGLSNINK